MKIGIFSDTTIPNVNGVVISIINEINALRNDYEFVVFVPKVNKGKFNWDFPCTTYEFPSIVFPPYPGYNISLPSRLLKHVLKTEKRFDLMHLESPFTQGYFGILSALCHQAPTVMTFHTWLSEYVGHLFAGFAEQSIKRWLGPQTWFYTRLIYNRATLVTTPSEMLRRELTAHAVKNVYAVPNPISPIFFQSKASSMNKHDFRQIFKIPADRTLILYVGRISFEKRLESLLYAYKELRAKNDRLFLAIVGDGPHIEMYKQMAKKLKLIDYVFTGYVNHEELPSVYQAGDVFCSPSDTETQGLTPIEAMSQGIPVVAVNAGGVVDYIHHNNNGLLAQSRDYHHIMIELQRALVDEELRKVLVNNGKQTALNYSFAGFRKNMRVVFDKALENPKL